MIRTAFAAIALLAACQISSAQSPAPIAWTSLSGRILYAEESGGSVLQYTVPFGDNFGYLYVDGLAGEFGGRGPLDGYWSEPDVSHDDENDTTLICPFAIIDGHGRTTRNWGRLRMMLTSDVFPSDFILLRGRCFEEPRDVLSARLER